jgi:alpha-L-rhamnosidase
MTYSLSKMRAVDLRTEYQIDPLGLDETEPRFSWQLVDTRRGARQSAYQVLVDDGASWDSGVVASNETTQIAYEGRPLRAFDSAIWKVRVWDGDGAASPWSAPARFELGPLSIADWEPAQYVQSTIVGTIDRSAPAPFLRRAFTAPHDVVRARLYVTALGLYDVSLNGCAVSDHVYAPGWTDYHRRVPYRAYDVTALVHKGENVLGAVLGDGWYCGFVGLQRQVWGDRPRLLAKLVVEVEGGDEPLVIATDARWRTSTGPILASDNYDGETYDARLELPGWDVPGYDDSAWQRAQVCPGFTSVGLRVPPVAAVAPPVRRIMELQPRAVRRSDKNTVFDFGQNLVGRVRLRVTAPAGTEVRLRFAEMLEPDGALHTENLLDARATDRYTCKGAGNEVYEPRFTFHGFRYVEAEGADLPDDALTAIVIHSDAASTGAFSCSNELVNRLHRNIEWSQRGNFVDVPTDCPQRAERMGWTGDIQVFARTATYLMDVAAFLSKYVVDLRDAQLVGGVDRGSFPWVVPSAFARAGGPGWADAGVVVPWVLYERFGDVRQLDRHYAAMMEYIDFLERFAQGRAEGTWLGFGDWLSLDPARLDVDDETRDGLDAGDSRFGGTPRLFLWDTFGALSTGMAARIASVLGREDDRRRLVERHGRVRDEFARRWVGADGRLTVDTQSAYALALRFDLLTEPGHRRAAEQDLIANVERVGHLQTGFLGTPHLLHALTDAGRVDLAYELLERTAYPGWLYPVTQGATTIWERWDGWTEERGFHPSSMNSFNHYAYGAVAEWLYRVVAGIDVDAEQGAGYRRVVVRPRPGGSLTHASAHVDTHRGRIETWWRLDADVLTVGLVLPPNTTAAVSLPSTSVDAVTENEVSLVDVHGVDDVELRHGRVEFAARAGAYTFRCRDR